MPPQQPQPNNPPSAHNPQATGDSNTIAIVGLILAFLIPLAGLICSIIGLKKAKESGGKNRGVAIAGIIISPITLLLSAIIFILIFLAVALQGDLRDILRQDDVQSIKTEITTYSNDNVGQLPTDEVALEEALGSTNLEFYGGHAYGLENAFGVGVYAVERTESVPAATDILPDHDRLHILIGAKCKTATSPPASSSNSPSYYSAGGSNVVEEAPNRVFAVIYALEREDSIICDDNL